MKFVCALLVVVAGVHATYDVGFLDAVLDQSQNASCTVYQSKATNCEKNCGDCFNPGSRPGVLCLSSTTGYYCPASSANGPHSMAFACMDWTFGSQAMQKAEAAFKTRTGTDVYFGVGSYGTSDDPQRGLGACYQMTVSGMDKPLLVQSVNTGSDVQGNQFDMQIGDGGAGAFDTCAGSNSNSSMYPGTTAPWGKQYGGVDNRADCSGLPPFPRYSQSMKAAGDDLVTMCQYGFDHGARMEGGGNPSIQSIGRVACPEELVQFTWFQRTDEPLEGEVQDAKVADHTCDAANGNLAWCLTRMMDCRKPSGGFIDNLQKGLMVTGRRVLQPCTNDGYTRFDVQCGCSDCYC